MSENQRTLSEILHESQKLNLTEARKQMMSYYVSWRHEVTAGRVLVTANMTKLEEAEGLRRLEESLREQHYSVFVPADFCQDTNELNFGERSHYISVLQKALNEIDFAMILVGEPALDYPIHVGMLSGRKPIITVGEQLPKPYDAIPVIHLHNESEVIKFFDLLDFKKSVANFNTRLTAVAGYLNHGRN